VRQQTSSTQGEAPRGVGASHDIDDVLPALYARLHKQAGRVLYKRHIPSEDAEDLVQTTMQLAVAKWKEIRNPGAWLLGTLRNRCVIYWRRRLPEECTRQLNEADLERGVEPDQTRVDLLADLGRVWHLLSPAHRRLLTLLYEAGLSPREAAEAMGLASTSVRKTAHRAIGRLREALALAPPPKPGGRRRPARQPPPANLSIVQGNADGTPIRLPAAQGTGAAGTWIASVDAFLAASKLTTPTRRHYRHHLIGAGTTLGWPPLAELTASDLLVFREALLADGRSAGTHICVLVALRGFISWAAEQGRNRMDPDVIRQQLRGCKWKKRKSRSAREQRSDTCRCGLGV